MTKENAYTIFYSWQSDKPDVKKAIFKELKNVKDILANDGIELTIEQDTSGRIGTKTLMKKYCGRLGIVMFLLQM